MSTVSETFTLLLLKNARVPKAGFNLGVARHCFEKILMQRALAECNYSPPNAARMLGILEGEIWDAINLGDLKIPTAGDNRKKDYPCPLCSDTILQRDYMGANETFSYSTYFCSKCTMNFSKRAIEG